MFKRFRRKKKQGPLADFVIGEAAHVEQPRTGSFPFSPPSLQRLMSVVPVVQTASLESGELTISALEMYEDGALIRYYFEGSPEARRAEEEFFVKGSESAILERISRRGDWLRRYAEQRVDVEDDLSTPYVVHPRGGGGGTLRWEGGFSMSPSIPSHAHQLRLTVAKLDFPWDIPGDIATISSPTTFVIDL